MTNETMQWYIDQANDERANRYYEILFSMYRKFKINFGSATPKERYFVEEVTRVTFELEEARKNGLPPSSVRPSFTKQKATSF